MAELARTVHKVTGDYRGLTPRLDDDSDVSRRVAVGRDQRDLSCDVLVGSRECHLSGLDDGLHRVLERGPAVNHGVPERIAVTVGV